MIAGLPLIASLVIVGFSIHKSKKRIRTILYMLRAIALLVGLVLTDLVGAATFDAMLEVGIHISPLVHSQKNKT